MCFTYNPFYHRLISSFDMDNSQLTVWKATWGNPTVWVDQETLDIVSTFACEGGLYHDFIEAVSLLDWGVFPPRVDKRICRKYEGCVVCFLSPLQWCWNGHSNLFSNYPFTIASSELGLYQSLTLLVWVQERCVSLAFFFHLFKAQWSFVDSSRGQGLISLKHSTKIFEVYLMREMNFKDRYYLVNEVDLANFYIIR